MTCKECIHYDVCDALESNGISKVYPSQCGCYKPKSRFVELPCEMGQTVYRTSGNYCGQKIEIYKGVIDQISIGKDGTFLFWVYGHPLAFTVDDIGKTVFLTKEEAEQFVTDTNVAYKTKGKEQEMREILFRGKTTLDNEWVVGAGVYKSEGYTWIITDDATKTENRGTGSDAINPKTVGQYIGLTDKNGKKIFEGDIVEGLDFTAEDGGYGVVAFDDGAFEVVGSCYNNIVGTFYENYYGKDFEVIGNVHDNPELLKGVQQ